MRRPFPKEHIEEDTYMPLTIRPEAWDGSVTSIESLRYRVDCLDTDTVLIDWTVLDPATRSLDIPASVNGIVNDANAYEVKLVTMQADYDLATKVTGVFAYRVKNNETFT